MVIPLKSIILGQAECSFKNKRIHYDYSSKWILFIYPALTGSKTPTSKFSESKEVRWEINCP
ncbi:hypothetical protein FSZ17_20660 [Cytobacillus dafuensis]|uniref:Uncharacterized protein n=1 Tax=Cytobacillus dafuensis TaxID=1742359 RepID=A0A5B8Z951_CYTDA|nr:hypothetical protein FSZ17_20660 [Cytobacillus dafuensis]